MTSLPPNLTSPPPSIPNTLITFPSPHIILLTLNRPSALNAIPSTHHILYHALWTWYDAQPSLRCAIISGGTTSRAFCAGADLKEWNDSNHSTSPQEGDLGLLGSPSGFLGLSNRTGKKPIIAAIHGLCLGGGMEAVINCDIVLASSHKHTKFGLPEVRRGVIPLAGALPRLQRIIGKQRAAEMVLIGRADYTPKTMHAWGLVNEVVSGGGEEVLKRAVEVAEEITDNSPDAVIVAREGLKLGWEGVGPDVATDTLAKGMFGRMNAEENMVEGVRSFVERRQPRWRNSKL